jgi:hypothetical protein
MTTPPTRIAVPSHLPPEDPIDPPNPPPSPAVATPARIAEALVRQLARQGFTDIYTATAQTFAIISVTADLTVWTNGHQLWCTHHGQRHTWPADDTEHAARQLAGLAGTLPPTA